MGKANFVIQKINLLVVPLGIILLIITSGTGAIYFKIQSAGIPETEAIMQQKANDCSHKILNHFNFIEKKTEQLSEHPLLLQLLETAKSKNNASLKTSFEKLDKHLTDSIFQTDVWLFKNILVVSAAGEIIFSSKHTNYIGKNLIARPLSDTQIGYSFMRSFMGLVQDISDFYYDEIIQEPALYISTPIFNHGIIEGILIAQIDPTKFYQFTQNYIDFLKTGEFVLGNRLGNATQIIGPTRLHPNIAFKSTGLYKQNVEIPLQFAVNGASGIGIGYDYRDMRVIAAWKYIPKADWGLVAKTDYAEVVHLNNNLKYLFIIFLLCSLLVWFLFLFIQPTFRIRLSSFLANTKSSFAHKNQLDQIIILLFSCALVATIYLNQTMNNSFTQALLAAQHKAKSRSKDAVQAIESQLNKLPPLVESSIRQLENGELTIQNVAVNIHKKLNEEPELLAFSIIFNEKNNSAISGFYGIHQDHRIEVKPIHELASTNETKHITNMPWYFETLQAKKSQWIQPFAEIVSDALVVTYAAPFFATEDTDHQNPLGVVAAMYPLDNIKPFLSNLSIGETGYPFIVNQRGNYIYHPREKYKEDVTIFIRAEKEGNKTLMDINRQIVSGRAGIASFEDLKTNQINWVTYEPIPSIKWTLCVNFMQDEITPPLIQTHHLKMWLIFCIIICLFFLGCFASRFIHHKPLRAFSLLSSFIFSCGILAIWHIIEPRIEVKYGTIVYSPIGLDSFFNELKKTALQRHEPEPIPLPTGVFIHSWKINSPIEVDLAGLFWQKYDKKDTFGKQEINFPDANKLSILNSYQESQNGTTSFSWDINLALTQQFDFSKYPLDSQQIRILMDHRGSGKNIVLVPDFSGYENIRPTDLPGIDKHFTYYGYKIDRSFYTLENIDEETDFGSDAYHGLTDHIKLLFNIVIVRDLLNTLIVYFLPLLVVLFSLFAIFSITGRIGRGKKKKIFVSISGYTGLLFALVALHLALRGQYPSTNLLYIEYFFFCTYITLLLAIIHGALIQAEVKEELIQDKVTPIARNLFWPVQLFTWFIITFIVFYN